MASNRRSRLPVIPVGQVQQILDNLDVSDLELSDDDNGDPGPNLDLLGGEAADDEEDGGEDDSSGRKDCRDSTGGGDVTEEASGSQRRVFWRLNSDFGEPAQLLGCGQLTTQAVRAEDLPHGGELDQTPLDFFRKYLTEALLEQIAICTNQRLAEQGKTPNVTREDIMKFIGICFHMSIIKFPWLKLYWTSKYRLPLVADVMSRNKFYDIRSNLKVVDDNRVRTEQKSKDRLWKVRPLLNAIRERCIQLDRPEAVAVDEQMIPFTGTFGLKQYVPNKPNPVGLKNWVLAEPGGLMLDFELNQGKEHMLSMLTQVVPGQKMGVGEAVVLRLAQTLPEGLKIYFDRYFTSVSLLDTLSESNLKGTGTIMKSRLPKGMQTPTASLKERGSSQCSVRQDAAKGPIGVTTWLDNKLVVLASNHEGIQPEDVCKRWSKKDRHFVMVKRPAVVRLYNKSMGGIDLLDRMVSLYRVSARTKKWTVRVILHMLDVVVVNSWIEYKKKKESGGLVDNKTMMQLLEFKMRLAEQLIEQGKATTTGPTEEPESVGQGPSQSGVVPLPSVERRQAGAQHMPEMGSGKEAYHRCRLPGCRKLARVKCSSCNVYLCLTSDRSCFKKFHK